MALSAADWQAEVIDQVGGDVVTAAYPGGILTSTMSRMWAMEATWSTNVALQALMVKRRAIQKLLALHAGDFNFTADGSTFQLAQRYANWQLMLKETEAQILEEKKAMTNIAVAASGVLTKTSPYGAPTIGYPDPNDPGYHGDPIYPTYLPPTLD